MKALSTTSSSTTHIDDSVLDNFDGIWDEWEGDEEREFDLNELEEFSLYEALKVPKKPSLSRIQAAFHKYSTGSRTDQEFSQVVLAYLVLKDLEKRRVYDECGWKMLKQSESYQAESVFEQDARQVFEDFFAGKSEQDRDYLLMNSGHDFSDSEDDNPNFIPIEEVHVSPEEIEARKKERAACVQEDDAEIDAMLRRFQMTGEIIPRKSPAPCLFAPVSVSGAPSAAVLDSASSISWKAKMSAFQLDQAEKGAESSSSASEGVDRTRSCTLQGTLEKIRISTPGRRRTRSRIEQRLRKLRRLASNERRETCAI